MTNKSRKLRKEQGDNDYRAYDKNATYPDKNLLLLKIFKSAGDIMEVPSLWLNNEKKKTNLEILTVIASTVGTSKFHVRKQ